MNNILNILNIIFRVLVRIIEKREERIDNYDLFGRK